MAYVSDSFRKQVTERAHGLCEYCQTAQLIVVSLEIDHILPEVEGGQTQLNNVCLTCRACNGFKQGFQTGIDSETGEEFPLFNPRSQNWSDHFRWSADGTRIEDLTPIGRATINRLKMNRDGVIASRRLWVQAGWHPPRNEQFPLN